MYRHVPSTLEARGDVEDAGMTRRMTEGAADMFDMLAKTQLAKETPEEPKAKWRTEKQIVQALTEDKAQEIKRRLSIMLSN
jgi:hypothetical protein